MCHVALLDLHYYWYEVTDAAVDAVAGRRRRRRSPTPPPPPPPVAASAAVDEEYDLIIADCETSIRMRYDALLAKAIADSDQSDREISALSERFADKMLTRPQIGACLKKGMPLLSAD